MASSSSAQGAAASAGAPPPPPPPSAAKKGFLRRALPLLLTANLAVGVYVFARTYQKDTDKKKEDEAAVAAPSALASTTAATTTEKTSGIPAPQPVTVHPPISEEEQRELFKWILEEKRKVKSRDKSERKKIDEEKALLKEFIRAKSLPSL